MAACNKKQKISFVDSAGLKQFTGCWIRLRFERSDLCLARPSSTYNARGKGLKQTTPKNLNTHVGSYSFMSESRQISVAKTNFPKLPIITLCIVFVVGLFIVGFDQGHTFSLVYGEQAFADLYIHELTHDMRHAAGFPCH